MQMYEYEIKRQCPTGIPGVGEITAAHLRGYVDSDTRDNVVSMNGMCPGWADVVEKAGQTVFSVGEIMALWNQGRINDAELPKFLRTAGVLNPDYAEGYKAVYEKVPDLGSVLDAISRNTEDADVQQVYGLDDGFDERMQGELKRWATLSGYSWAAMRFLYRLRRPAVSQRDIIRLYRSGAIDRPEVLAAYKFAGHSDKVSGWFADALERLYKPTRSKQSGMPSLQELESWYVDGVLAESEYRDRLQRVGVPAEDVSNYVDTADLKKRAGDVKWLEPKVTSAYTRGRIDRNEYLGYLAQAGMNADEAESLAGKADVEKDVSNKQLAAAQICTLVSRGFIAVGDGQKRLTNLGFTDEDATLLNSLCVAEIQEKRQKEVERQQREAAAAAQQAKAKRERECKKQVNRAKTLYKERAKLWKSDNPKGTYREQEQAIGRPPEVLTDCDTSP